MRRILSCFMLVGCVGTKMVPPPGTPAPVAPAQLKEDPPRAANKQRLVLDVVGTPATAFEIVQARGDEPDAHALKPLCETPCAVNLATGSHRVAFVSPRGYVGQEVIVLGERPLVVREQLGYVETHPLPFFAGVASASLGGFAALFGVALVAQGDGPTRDAATLRDVRAAGAALLVGSAVLLGAAWLLLHVGRTEIQPSAAAVFPEP